MAWDPDRKVSQLHACRGIEGENPAKKFSLIDIAGFNNRCINRVTCNLFA